MGGLARQNHRQWGPGPVQKLTDLKSLAAHLSIFGAKTRRFLADVACARARRLAFRVPAVPGRPAPYWATSVLSWGRPRRADYREVTVRCLVWPEAGWPTSAGWATASAGATDRDRW